MHQNIISSYLWATKHFFILFCVSIFFYFKAFITGIYVCVCVYILLKDRKIKVWTLQLQMLLA